jgi:hypothetical protein
MRTRSTIAILAAAGVCLLATRALAQFPPVTDPNKDEAKCERGTGKALNKMVGAKSKCVTKCITTARKTSGPYTQCFAPFSDPTTQACINDPLKGATTKARAAIVKACSVDCPECYDSQDPNICTTGDPFVSNSSAQTDPFGELIWCLEDGGTTPDKLQAKCEDGTSKSLVKFIGSVAKCYEKCNVNQLKGKIMQGSCDAPSPSDPATQTCVANARTKGALAIDKLCANVPGATPPCFALTTGNDWVNIVESAVEGNIPNIACGA